MEARNIKPLLVGVTKSVAILVEMDDTGSLVEPEHKQIAVSRFYW